MWLIASAAVIVGAVAVVVAAFTESRDLVAVASDRPGPITPEQLRHPQIPVVWRGYDPGTVDALLARAARALEEAEQNSTEVAEGTLPRFLAATFNEDDDPGTSVWTARLVPGQEKP